MPKPINKLLRFLDAVLFQRDRYMLEVCSSLVTFSCGILASLTLDNLSYRQSMNGFRDMPCPELWVILATIPGTWVAIRPKSLVEFEHRRSALAIMSSFWVLSLLSWAFNVDNWVFWSLLALLIGSTQGYAIARDLRDLRWGVAFLGSFFWVSFSISLATTIPWPWPFTVVTVAGWALANLLSVRRLALKVG